MWYLINATNPEQKYVLLADTDYVVGRRDCQILVGGDAAVSRKHAIIHLNHPETSVSHPHKLSLVTLKDVSKFGTWVNKEQLKGETTIKDGDEMYFGSAKSTFLLVNEPFIVTTSCLENVSKKRVKAIARTLGGHVVNEWRKDCSLLIMNHISVTIKVICAMVSLKAVVTPKYLDDFIIYLKGEGPEPDTQKFLPPIAESQVNPDSVSFGADARRTTLFLGMKFIFLSQRQFKKMSLAIELAGGIPVLMEEGTDDNDDEVLSEDGTVVMNCGPEEHRMLTENGKKWFQHVQAYLKMKKKQLIQDSEIGYAVLYSSTERHCNPNINTAQNLMPIPSQSLSERVADPSQIDVLVENTNISQQTTDKKRGDRKPLIADKQETLLVSRVKKEPVSQDIDTSFHGTKRAVSSSVVEDSEMQPRSTDGQTIKQEKETKKIKESIAETSTGSRSPALRTSNEEVTKKDSGDNDVTTRSNILSKSTRKCGNLGIFDDRDDEDTGPTSSKRIVSAKSKRTHADFDPFEESDDDDVPISSRPSSKSKRGNVNPFEESDDDDVPISSRPPSKSKRGNVNPFEESDDDDVPISSRPPSKSKHRNVNPFEESDDDDIPTSSKHASGHKKRKHDDDDNEERSSSKKKCPVLVEDSEFSVKIQHSAVIPESNVKLEKDDKREVVATVGSYSHLVHNSEIASIPLSPRKRVKQEAAVRRADDDEDTMATKQDVTARSPVMNGDVPAGFLTTRKPIKNQVVKSEVYEKEPDLPENIVVTLFVDLVKRPVQPQKQVGGTDVPDGFVKWKGKIVKNFKKFKKINNMGSNRLPNIIGGSDLVAHTGSQRRDLDDWCKEALEAESQQNESDRAAQDLFNWEPSTTRRKHSR